CDELLLSLPPHPAATQLSAETAKIPRRIFKFEILSWPTFMLARRLSCYNVAASAGIGGPVDLVALVLFVKPLLERREVVENRGGVHLLFAGHGLERFRPRLALAHF